jgi:cyclophilin family peptidyl-prolyl cis-trans isomerase/HEAT repeat protein
VTRRGLSVLLLSLVAIACAGSDGGSDVVGIERIAEIEDERYVGSGELVEALADGSVEVRARAALAMGRIQDERYFAPLIEATRPDVEREVRLRSLFALGQLGLAVGMEVVPAAVEACREALADDDLEVVVGAVQALGKLGTPEVPGIVTPLLGHDSADVRSAAAHALFRCRFVPLWRREAEEAPPLPDASVEALLATASDPDPEVRRAVAYAFSRYGDPRATTGVAKLVTDPDEWARLFAVRAIGRAGESSGVDTVMAALDDDSLRVRTEAVGAVAALGGFDRLPASLADDASFHVRTAYVQALGQSESRESLATLERLEREDASPTVRAAAVGAIAARRGDDGAARLKQLLSDDDWRVRAAAARAAGQLTERALEVVRPAAADPDVRVRSAALGALDGRDDGNDLIDAALGDDDLAIRGIAVDLLASRERPDRLERLTSAYDASPGEAWIEIREQIADGVAELDGAVPLLERMATNDPATSVRQRARLALERAGQPAATGSVADVPARPFALPETGEDPTVVLETAHGEIRIRCFARDAPMHVNNFVRHVNEGFYDGLIWHRVVSNFVIQGGDPRGDGWGSAGPTLRDEINTRTYGRGAVGMPKAGKDTGSCQIFVTHVPTPHLDGNYTVFGQVVSGMEAVDRIEVGDAILGARVE